MQRGDFTTLSPGRLVPTDRDALSFLPEPAPRTVALDALTTKALERANHRLGKLSGAASRLVNPYLVGAQLLRREAILSSRIEETFATPEQIALYELGTGSRTEDTREVGNFVRAMEHALEAVRAGDPITTRLMLGTHRVLMTGVRGERERPGEFRMSQNFIGRSSNIHEARFVPPPHLELPALLSDLERLMNEDAEDLPTLARIAIAHYQFEAVHPFRDGNGRIGRLLIMLMLVREGLLSDPVLPLSSALDRHRDAYVDGLLEVSRRGAWDHWIRFFLDCIVESADEALRTVDALDTLRVDMHRSLQSARSSALLLKLVDALFERPAITIGAAATLLGVTPASASANIAKLEDAGILEEITGRTRDRVYVARGILNIVSDNDTRG